MYIEPAFSRCSGCEVLVSQDPPNNYIEAKIVGDTHVRIRSINEYTDWSKPVYAINWFDARQLQLYNFYNLLAGRSVNQVGGVPLFKGRLVYRQYGSDEDEREMLLLVKYPSPVHFKNMLGNTYFKCVSVLRNLAVKRFTFCLSHVTSTVNFRENWAKSEYYGVHHFCGCANTLELITAALDQHSIELSFSSAKTHELCTVTGAKEPVPVPTIMDCIVVFRCEGKNMLTEIVSSELYKRGLQQSLSSYVGLFKRIL